MIIIPLRRQDRDMFMEEVLSSVLYSCSRAGLYNEAFSIYSAMVSAKLPIKEQYERLVLKACRTAGRSDLYSKYSESFHRQLV